MKRVIKYLREDVKVERLWYWLLLANLIVDILIDVLDGYYEQIK